LRVKKGEILALLGPSGCGKTTTLRLIAGFEVPDAGRIELGGELMTGGATFVPPEQRGVGIVFQDFALFPHLTVERNVAFGLRRLEARLRDRRAREIIETVGLCPFAKRYPHELSGGQAQRVALARALAPRPSLLLLDEPLVSLDAPLKEEMILELKEIQRRLGVTTLYITHDQAEAMKVADRLAVMRQGRLEQVDSPETVYLHPRSRFVASFLGKATLLEGVARSGRVQTLLGSFDVPGPDGRVTLAVRPEDLQIDEAGAVRGRLVERLFLGQEGVAYLVEVNGTRLRCPGPPNGMRPLRLGQEVALSVVRPPAALED
jgi:iron(III) transport system ATP-binding protein